MGRRVSWAVDFNEVLAHMFPLAPVEIQQALEPSWSVEDSDYWNSIYQLPNGMVILWAEDGPDNGDGLGRTGLFVYPESCFKGYAPGRARLQNGYFIDTDKPGWKLRVRRLAEGKVPTGIERVAMDTPKHWIQ